MKSILIITMIMIPFLCGNAQKNSDSGIVFDTTLYQFGSVKEGSNKECVFTFVNKNKTPVVITKVKVFCGCVVPAWTKEPVKPDASGEIIVKFYANTIGTFSKTIHVFTSSDDQSVGLTIKGTVTPVSTKK